MLIDEQAFKKIEDALMDSGRIDAFEKENGPIQGHMMITEIDIPADVEIKKVLGKEPVGFEASFDFYDATMGVAIYTDTKQVASRVWYDKQKSDAEIPSEDWVYFFIDKLVECIEDDGSYGVPMCSFVTDDADMTVAPTRLDNS